MSWCRCGRDSRARRQPAGRHSPGHGSTAAPARALPQRRPGPAGEFGPSGWRPHGAGADPCRAAGGGRQHWATVGTANGASSTRDHIGQSSTGNRIAPQRQSPSVRACTRWPGPSGHLLARSHAIPPRSAKVRSRSETISGTCRQAPLQRRSATAAPPRPTGAGGAARPGSAAPGTGARPVITMPRQPSQGGLEILRFAERRRDAVWHFRSPLCAGNRGVLPVFC